MTLKYRRAGHDEAAELDLVDCVAMPSAARDGVRSRLRWRRRARPCLHVSGKLLERQLGIAEQLIEGSRVLHLDQLQLGCA